MSRQKQLFTSESVTEGHPDKICDQISDAILDAIYTDDPMGRVACETLVTTGLVVVAGEISTSTYVDIPKIVRDTVRGVGYTRAKFGFDGDTCGVITAIDEQSPDIADGVDHALEERTGEAAAHGMLDTLGAGDQGMVFGFAVIETPELMPMPIMLAHKLARRLAAVRRDHTLKYLRPDGKTQVTVEYENGKPKEIETVIVSTQHGPDVSNKQLTADILEHVLKPVLPKGMVDYKKLNLYVNPSGKFVVGGPQGDTGVTGRKIIVDTYGGMARHGGGCFSGKDPTKVDRSGAYYTRYAAKNVVAAGLAEKCEIQVAYAIGKAHPVSVRVDTFETETVDLALIEKLVRENFDFRPAAIINELNLRRPIFKQTAAYGHFGREEADFMWERTDKAQILKKGTGA